MRSEHRRIPISDVEERFVRVVTPGEPAGGRTLVIVHGVGEHSGRYEHFIRTAVSRGWTVIAGDLRGHGNSTGVPTHLDCFSQYLDDLNTIWEHFELDARPTALFGHSMGGLVATRFAQTFPDRVAAVVLSSPLLAFGVRVPPLKRTFGRVCLYVAPHKRFQSTIPLEHITSNESALQLRINDPLANRSVTAGWYFRVMDALYSAWQEADRLTAPLLLLQGEADQVVRAEAPLDWYPNVGSADKSLHLLPGLLHELLNEPGWKGTIDRILGWLEHRIPSESRCSRSAVAGRDHSLATIHAESLSGSRQALGDVAKGRQSA
ncbi:MAG: alpha/beta fold hydrolase [Planctomycetota bacterium]|nr:MAG: alpha/beta fold hydrolase [Planctomycetota bacterium]REJ94222.1 MAG: alpha/beta fold hydrolase [Planctomycetota bacterium]REK20203.1 MAG: alpha/beta fold hydrolase [Planctomycetota bacterium]REK35344.1 MAG: alpha/beta fold hydrolase [Planctomycetota bacterium]